MYIVATYHHDFWVIVFMYVLPYSVEVPENLKYTIWPSLLITNSETEVVDNAIMTY